MYCDKSIYYLYFKYAELQDKYDNLIKYNNFKTKKIMILNINKKHSIRKIRKIIFI